MGAKPALPDFDEDVETIIESVMDVVDEGGDAVMVFHSYGSMPGNEALRGLGKKQREEKGRNGGVVGILMMAAYLPQEGSRVKPELNEGGIPSMPDWKSISENVSSEYLINILKCRLTNN